MRFLITKGPIIPARYLNFHLNLNVIHHYDVSLVQQLTLAEHSPSSGAFFGSTSNTLSLTHFYQKDERPFLGPFRTTCLSASFPIIKAISCTAPSTLLPSPPTPHIFKCFSKFKSLPPHHGHSLLKVTKHVLLNPADCAHYHILKYTTNDLLYKVFPQEFTLYHVYGCTFKAR